MTRVHGKPCRVSLLAGSGEVPLTPAERSAERERRQAAQAGGSDSDCLGLAECSSAQA